MNRGSSPAKKGITEHWQTRCQTHNLQFVDYALAGPCYFVLLYFIILLLSCLCLVYGRVAVVPDLMQSLFFPQIGTLFLVLGAWSVTLKQKLMQYGERLQSVQDFTNAVDA